ncbi:hypothetical protein G5B38_04980 [Pseudohalocynthiibacter aestuariivivens]|nr:hypothetical protein [Pseudohalocynthiibacter aestuariivivens]QIE44930.1 hypothetical protein G5B38_04980 [Pseudohalocynthiibacter aestuariivivens]
MFDLVAFRGAVTMTLAANGPGGVLLSTLAADGVTAQDYSRASQLER